MRRHILLYLTILFSIAAITLVIIQVSQTQKSAKISDNLFNVSVSNAMDEVFDQLDQMKIEDYVSHKERYRILRYRRIDEMNERMQDIIRDNGNLFYDERRVSFGVSSQDSIVPLPHVRFTQTEQNVMTQYNTLLNARNRLLGSVASQQPNDFTVGLYNPLDATKLNFPLLDSLIREQLIIGGVDINPAIGVLLAETDTLLYCSEDADTVSLLTTAYKYSFHPNGIDPDVTLYVLLAFPPLPIMYGRGSNLYTLLSIFMILLISALFYTSIRTIVSQRNLDEMKTDFINNMTHEIKTPLSTIALACEMLQDESVTSDSAMRSNFLNIISEENTRLRTLVETLLQSAKMSGKHFSLSPSEVDLNKVVEKSVQSFRLAIDSKRGKLTTNLSAIEGTLYADEMHISNMLHNLIDNAIKYSNGAPVVDITTSTDNGYAVLKVSDNGIGISKADQKHVFEKFYRVSTGDVHNVKGFGIGLNYVAQVVALHSGTISLESELGRGSTFTIRLPLS